MKLVKNIILIPFWLVSPLTQLHSFNNPVIGNRVLNILGLHIMRVVASHSISHFKFSLMAFLIPKEDRIEFHKNGFLLKENFLPEELFLELEDQVRNNQHGARDLIQNKTITRRLLLDSKIEKNLPACRKLREYRYFHNLLRYTSAKNEHPRSYAEDVINKTGDDPQKILHKDSFYPTMKAWLYLDDVSDVNGPFNYVAGSQKLTWKRIKWEYAKSIEKPQDRDRYSQKGSFRATKEDLRQLGLGEPQDFKVKKNSLLIANTFGLHCRGQAQNGSSRLSVWVSSRANPFNPWPGINSDILRNMRDQIQQLNFRRKDWLAEKQGKRPSWKLSDNIDG